MTTSRDEALKLARMHVSGEAYGRLVSGDAYVLARAIIDLDAELSRVNEAATRQLLEIGEHNARVIDRLQDALRDTEHAKHCQDRQFIRPGCVCVCGKALMRKEVKV